MQGKKFEYLWKMKKHEIDRRLFTSAFRVLYDDKKKV